MFEFACNTAGNMIYILMANYELVHPLYLDYQMMTSFVAFLEGGFSLEDEQKMTTQGSKETEGKGSLSAKLPALPLIGVSAAGEGSASGKSEHSVDYQEKRHRTEASLFNYLYKRLKLEKSIHVLNSMDDLPVLNTGDLVEVSGEYKGNPLSDVVALGAQYVKYAEGIAEDAAREKKKQAAASRSGNPAVRSSAQAAPPSALATQAAALEWDPVTKRIMEQMQAELEASPVHDVLLSGLSGVEAVLTVSADYFTSATREFLREGEVRVMGKLTRILSGNEQINLSRRTLFGVAGGSLAEGLEAFFRANPGLGKTKSLIHGPAIQILPMAIFV